MKVVSAHVIGSVIIRVAKGLQKPVYYISKELEGVETRYFNIEKLILDLFVSLKKLHLYFPSHTIVVVTSYPLRAILHSPNVADQLMKWLVVLSKFHIVYQSRTILKAQVLVDFVAEFTHSEQIGRPKGCTNFISTLVLNVDRLTNVRNSRAGIILKTLDDTIIEQLVQFAF